MGKHTKIQWTHSTINPTSGCDGCELYTRPPSSLTTDEELRAWLLKQPCYASQVHELRWAKSLAVTHPSMYGPRFSDVRLIPGRMEEASRWGPVTEKEAEGKPWFTTSRRHIFISDMSDALSRDVPFDFLKAEIIDNVTSEKGRRNVWQWLTKRPQRMAEFDAWLAERNIAWPKNLWAGTSVTNQRTADMRVPALLKVRAKVRFLSCEPLFDRVEFSNVMNRSDCVSQLGKPALGGISWVIVGGASGNNPAPFDLRWARSIVSQCRTVEVACFVKQLGAKPYVSPEHDGATGFNVQVTDSHGGDWSEWPEDLRVRQIPQ